MLSVSLTVITFLITALVCSVLLLKATDVKLTPEQSDALTTLRNYAQPFDGTSASGERVDCTLINRFCVNAQQCTALCQDGTDDVVGARLEFTCTSGLCVPDIGPPPDVPCNDKHGFLNTITTTEFGRQWYCLNTLPELFNDRGQLHEYVCRNGEFDLDAFDANTTTDFNSVCKCNEGYDRANYIYSPNVPLCLTPKFLEYFTDFVKE